MSGSKHSLKYKAVVFDCDGVLADSEPAWFKAEEDLCELYGLPKSRSGEVPTMGTTMRNTAQLLLEGMVDHFDLDQAEQEYVEFGVQRVPGSVKAMPNAPELVRSLSELLPVAVASNSPREVLPLVLREIGVLDFLVGYVAGNDVPEGKPHPDIYLKAVGLTGFTPAEVLVVEDSVTGMTAARAAGCDVFQVGAESHHKDHMALVAAPNLPRDIFELRELLSQL
jgi:HAD superfamily hydrolase (TIGR01509 family)